MNIWKTYKKISNDSNFTGLPLDQMEDVENCFSIKVIVYSLNDNGTISLIFNSLNSYIDKMYLNLSGNHLSYITNFSKFAKKFECAKCSKLFKREWNMKKHYVICYNQTKHVFPGGFYSIPVTIFDKLRTLNIDIPENLEYYDKFVVWDMEAVLLKREILTSDKLTWISEHVPVSVSIASNVAGYESPVCFVNEKSDELINEMMTYLSEISASNKDEMFEKYDFILAQIDNLLMKYANIELESNQNKKLQKNKILSHIYKSLCSLKQEFLRYISQVPVIGFNSGRYDINLIKKEIMSYITENYQDTDIFTIKKNNSYLSVSVPDLKFIDISNYLAAGSSYSQFLKAYGSTTPKGIFPYEWFDTFEKLNDTSLPPASDFYSSIKKENPIQNEDNYKKLLKIWNENHMTCFKDYLIYYNNLDTGPFCEALESFLQIYFNEGIDIFKDFITLPGVARKMLYKSTISKFSLFNQNNADLYYTFRQNIVGGPSIIFTRYHEKGETNIKKIDKNKCKSVVGYDCNGLYSYAIRENMPTGVYVRRKFENSFRPEVSERYIDSYVWMDYLMKIQNIKILHKLNNSKEIRFGNYLVDGYCVNSKTVYEFNGCYFHGCPHKCFIVKNIKNHYWLKRLEEIQKKDEIKRKYLEREGLSFISIQQCEFIKNLKPKCLHFYENYLPKYYIKNKGKLTAEQIVYDINMGRLFGVAEVDITIKEGYEKYFEEFPPFFCTCDVPLEAIGDHMQEYCKNNDINFKTRHLLISGQKAKKILMSTPLLQWYLNHNCIITKIYQVIEFQPEKSFSSFIDTVTKNRIMGDQDKDKTIIGDTYKLISNSSYGSILINKTKHCNVKYMKEKGKVTKLINSFNFKHLENMNNGIFEVEMYKKKVLLDTPIQIGFFILQYAKLRMLEFYHDCLVKYLKPNSFELTEMDTDSMYMALNNISLDECIRDEYKEKYFSELFDRCSDNVDAVWFPRRCCSKHIQLDKRFTGIMKLEFSGDKMISLCSKSYIIEDSNGKQKISCKGVSKKRLEEHTFQLSYK